MERLSRPIDDFEKKYRLGKTDSQLKELRRMEDERIREGQPSVFNLDLPRNIVMPYFNLGIKTIRGITEIIEGEFQPRNIGKKSLQVAREVVKNYASLGSK